MFKHLWVYYIATLAPFSGIFFLIRNNHIDSGGFFMLLFFYGLVYQPFIAGLRLIQGEQIERRDFWKVFIPFWVTRHYSYLIYGYSARQRLHRD